MNFADLESCRSSISNGQAKGVVTNGEHQQSDPWRALASGIFQINTVFSAFQRLVNSLGTRRDSPDLRRKLQQTRTHIIQLVKDTSAKLKQANELDHHEGISANRRIVDARLAKDFETILRDFQKAQHLAAEKETASSPISQTAPTLSSSSAIPIDSDESLDKSSNHVQDESRSQRLALLENDIFFDEAIIKEREQGILDIQQLISDVSGISKDLAVLISGQGTAAGMKCSMICFILQPFISATQILVDDLQKSVQRSYPAKSQAKSHLSKASISQRSNSSMSCLLMMIFGITLLIVIVVLIS